MTLNQALAKIGSIVGLLGLNAAVDLNALLHTLGVPDWAMSLPAWAKALIVVALLTYSLVVTRKASQHNPDGTPATQSFVQPRPGL